jgi:hypothetical protein
MATMQRSLTGATSAPWRNSEQIMERRFYNNYVALPEDYQDTCWHNPPSSIIVPCIEHFFLDQADKRDYAFI